MMYEIFRFEIEYRLKRPETYLFFLFLFGFSIFGTDFIFQGVELGMVKMNAPIVIGKSMGATTGIFLILASMIMGMPILRDDQYAITSLMYTQPIEKADLLMGRFLGSFVVLLFVFLGVPLGMMLGELLPWRLESQMLPFRFGSYLSTFCIIVLPILFFGASLFFVTGSLSRKLIVVYTQGIILFVVFMLTKAITNELFQALLDPFSLTTITQLTENWTVDEKNAQLLPFEGILLINKVFWIVLGTLILIFGYRRFQFAYGQKSNKASSLIEASNPQGFEPMVVSAYVSPGETLRFRISQFFSLSLFYCRSLLRETSFWAIVVCGVIIIVINSISLGTIHGVDSCPTTYFIVEELQELSLYFFVIILLFYSGELYWKEDSAGLNLMTDATAISDFVRLSSKVAGLTGIYIVLMLSLICSGIMFQVISGYYHFDFHVYFMGFFVEVLPFLVLYTFVAFFFQAVANNKFLGILFTLIFFIVALVLPALGLGHPLLSFGGGSLQSYSEMNGYGHYLMPYLITKLYWLIIGILMVIIGSSVIRRGVDTPLGKRLKEVKLYSSHRMRVLSYTLIACIVGLGSFIFYETSVLNEVWSEQKQINYRADYEKTLKQFEYIPQLQIFNTKLHVELYPDERAYDIRGAYILKNENNSPISEIHIQKQIDMDVTLDEVSFSKVASIDSQYQAFDYIIYHLEEPIGSEDTLTMYFHQSLSSKGFDTDGDPGSVLQNGTFIRNNEFPTLGYNRKHELRDPDDREQYDLPVRLLKAEMEDHDEMRVARSGSDAHGVITDITIGTDIDQIAVTSGDLIKKWQKANRNYFRYQSMEPMINLYSVLSGRYDVLRDVWQPSSHDSILLEIYYHPRHTYNLESMMKGMKASLMYYSVHFSPYQYAQLRILEFPRYESFAQSFPNTIPFSESIGFMLNMDPEEDIDMAFFITAHEVAHQWWGMQVEAANVQGQHFILETMAQYSALMVFKHQYSASKLDDFMAIQKEKYDEGLRRSKVPEVPLNLVTNEKHLYYNKGVIVMYEIEQLIGEDKINKALKSFISDWNSKNGSIKTMTDRYATSEDLIAYILRFTPIDELSRVEDLLRCI